MFRSGIWTLRIALLATALLVSAAAPVVAQHGRGGGAHGTVSHPSVYHGGYYHGASYAGNYYRGYYHPGYGVYYGYPYSYGWRYPYYYSGSVVINTTPYASYYYNPTPYVPSYPYAQGAVETIPAAVSGAAPVTVEVHVPANAQVWFDDTLTSQTGESRTFASPPLPIGQTFYYTIHARWTDNGRVIDQTRRIEVHPRQTTVVDFTKS